MLLCKENIKNLNSLTKNLKTFITKYLKHKNLWFKKKKQSNLINKKS